MNIITALDLDDNLATALLDAAVVGPDSRWA